MTEHAETYQFHAFISYKRGGGDEYWATWLQRKLERYRIPVKLPANDDGKALLRRLKIFRDKTDLGSHTDLGSGLRSSLDSCRFLIVICSPRSAASPYVDDEVRHFMEAGREKYIIPFIIDGSPVPVDATEPSCFPPTLPLHCLGVDCREGSKEETLIKVVARLLQVNFSFLYQRHLRAQRRSILAALAASVVILAVVSCLAVWALNAEQRATAQRVEAEGLVEFLIGDVGEKTFRYVPLSTRRGITEKVERYYERWGSSATEKGMLARARHSRNLAANAKAGGDYAAVLEHLQHAAAILEKLVAQYPKDRAVLRESHMVLQGLFEAAWSMRNPAEAERFLEKDLDLAQRYAALEALTPQERAETLAVLAEALDRGAFLAWEKGDRDESVKYTRMEVEAREKEYTLEQENPTTQAGLSSALLNLCSRLRSDNIDEAQKACSKSLELARTAAKNDPFNQEVQERLIRSYIGSARNHFVSFRLQEALDEVEKAVRISRAIASHDPESFLWQGLAGSSLAFHAIILEFTGAISREEASVMLREGGEMVERYAEAAKGTTQEQNARNTLAWYQELQSRLSGAADEQEITATLERARAAARQSPDDPRLLRLYADAAESAFMTFSNTRAPSEQLLKLAQETKDAYARYIALVPSDTTKGLSQCRFLTRVGMFLQLLGSWEEAEALFKEALDAAGELRRAGLQSGLLYQILQETHDALGTLFEISGRCDEAHEQYVQALHFIRAAGETTAPTPLSRLYLSMTLLTAGNSYSRLGESDQGLALLREAVALSHAVVEAERGDNSGKSRLFELALPMHAEGAGVLGLELCLVGQDEEGVPMLQESVRLARESGRMEVLMPILVRSARAHIARGKAEEGLRDAQEAGEFARSSLREKQGAVGHALTAMYVSGLTQLSAGHVREALDIAGEAFPAALQTRQTNAHNAYGLACFFHLKGAALLAAGDAPEAKAAFEEGLARIAWITERTPREIGWGQLHARLYRGLGDTLLALQSEDALDAYGRSLDILRRLTDRAPTRRDCRAELLETLDAAAAAFARAKRDNEAAALRREAKSLRGQ